VVEFIRWVEAGFERASPAIPSLSSALAQIEIGLLPLISHAIYGKEGTSIVL